MVAGERRGPSLRRRLLFGLLAVLVVLIAGLGTAEVLVLREVLYQRSAQGLRTELQLLAASESTVRGSASAVPSSCSGAGALVAGEGIPNGPPSPPGPGGPPARSGPTLGPGGAAALAQVLAQRGIASAVVGPHGSLIACATAAQTGPQAGFTVPASVAKKLADLHGSRGYVTASSGGRHLLAISQPLGADTAILVTDLASDDAAVRTVILVTMLGGLAAVAVAVLLSRPLLTSGLAPLRKVARAADAIAAGDLDQRAALSRRGDEVGRLGTAFDAMVDRLQAILDERDELVRQLEARERAMRRFVADASHELRTPLTAIRGASQVLRLGAASDPVELCESLGHIQAQAERMSRLVSDLLLLSAHWQGLYKGRPISVRTEEAWVQGNRDSLTRMASNLVDNAAKYSPASSPVEVTVRVQRGTAELAVVDHGPGISVEERQRVFERFYRGDPARARSTGGTGLGLAIVASIAAEHHGTVEVRETLGGGARLVVKIPLLGSPPK
jgi:signal transduction histidine kinase